MLSIQTHETAMLLFAQDGLGARLRALRHERGFLQAARFDPVAGFGEHVAYTRWVDHEAARAAIGEGDRAAFRAVPVKVCAVRAGRSSPPDAAALSLGDRRATVLISAMAVDPEQSDRLMDLLAAATDEFLPAFDAVKAVAFHRSRDRSLVVEVLHVSGALAFGALQLKKSLRRHRRRVRALTSSSTAGLYRLRDTV